MKAKEIRTKYRIMITGVAMAALLAGTAACSSAPSANSSSAGAETVTVAATENTDESAGGQEDTETTQSGQAAGETEEDAAKAASGTAAADGTDSASADGTQAGEQTAADSGQAAAAVVSGPAKEDITVSETVENTEDGGHAILADGDSASYSNTQVTKTGSSDSGDEADFYGDNAAVFATNGATLDLTQMVIGTNGTHANGVFSYGEGTTVNISDSYIETSGDCSGGLMTTGGGTMNADNLTIHTSGRSSAAIRSDRGGGTVNVTGGTYTTDGVGSPVVYSTADITVNNAQMTSTASQGIVVEGKNSVTLNNVDLTADNNQKNSDKSDYYQAVMIYQSMSGDAAEGTSSFTMNGGTMTNLNGDVFFVTNTATTVDLTNAEIINNGEGVFLRAAAAGWGSSGSNGGHVNLTASAQEINGDVIADEVSEVNLYLKDNSTFTGAVNPDGASGSVYVEIEDGSKWVLTGDSYVTSLTCGADAIDLNGYTLHVGDTTYEAGTASTGEAIEFTLSTGNGGPGGAPDGNGGPGGAPDGQGGPGGAPGNGSTNTPPAKPDGNPPAKPDGNPPAKPDENPTEKPDGNTSDSTTGDNAAASDEVDASSSAANE